MLVHAYTPALSCFCARARDDTSTNACSGHVAWHMASSVRSRALRSESIAFHLAMPPAERTRAGSQGPLAAGTSSFADIQGEVQGVIPAGSLRAWPVVLSSEAAGESGGAHNGLFVRQVFRP